MMNEPQQQQQAAHQTTFQSTSPTTTTQLKGEAMDYEFSGIVSDTDHRKRRRNRTTQSCLNCHTSKRKCDRKRPCQRCIQLGLTGLCVYEIDDPALRDDPTIDETTRLRNRIAELESLVRELRGKPHPRWADSTFRDGVDPSEKWHSRASKCIPSPISTAGRPQQPPRRISGAGSPREGGGTLSSLLTPIKTETANGSPLGAGGAGGVDTPSLYRFSPSPTNASGRYGHHNGHNGPFQNSPTSPVYDTSSLYPISPTHQHQGTNGHHHASQHAAYSSPTSQSYSDAYGPGSASSGEDAEMFTISNSASVGDRCECHESAETADLQAALDAMMRHHSVGHRHHSQSHRHLQHTSPDCSVLRRAVELDHLLQSRMMDSSSNASATAGGSPTGSVHNVSTAAANGGMMYDTSSSSNTPTETEILTPLSASTSASFPHHPSSHHHHVAHHPGAAHHSMRSPVGSPHEWPASAGAQAGSGGQYGSSYFPTMAAEAAHGMYTHVMS